MFLFPMFIISIITPYFHKALQIASYSLHNVTQSSIHNIAVYRCFLFNCFAYLIMIWSLWVPLFSFYYFLQQILYYECCFLYLMFSFFHLRPVNRPGYIKLYKCISLSDNFVSFQFGGTTDGTSQYAMVASSFPRRTLSICFLQYFSSWLKQTTRLYCYIGNFSCMRSILCGFECIIIIGNFPWILPSPRFTIRLIE